MMVREWRRGANRGDGQLGHSAPGPQLQAIGGPQIKAVEEVPKLERYCQKFIT